MAVKTNISIIIIAGCEETVIERALKSASFADEIIFVAANSNKGTINLAKKYTEKIYQTEDEFGKHFAKWRNLGLSKANNDWVFYLDSDEEITLDLKTELINIAKRESEYSHYAVPRQNYYLGKKVRFGGSWPDYVKRYFRRSALKKWQGKLHEQPIISGEIGYLSHFLNHYTHRDLTSMMEKTIAWTELEAKALHEAGHPPVAWWRFFRMMATKFWERMIKQKAWKDGTVGWINSIFEVFNTFIIYARLWEMQNKK